MGAIKLTAPVTLRFTDADFARLYAHLFPGDDDEHGAVLLCGTVTTGRGTRLLVRDLVLARDGIDYVPGQFGYRALTADFVARCSDRAAREGLAYLAVHCHGGSDSVAFSPDDMRSHERGYPALLDITDGGPVGALVFAKSAAAGDIWTTAGRHTVDEVHVTGMRPRRLYPQPAVRPIYADPVFNRSARIYGDVGQKLLAESKVGIVGMGGVGAMLNEWMSRLGVGNIVAIDPERLDITNLPRVVGASRLDALYWLQRSRNGVISRIGKRLARRKVDIGRRMARQANPDVQFTAVASDFINDETARMLVDADFIFLAADTFQCRLVFNALVQQYLISGAQAGTKVPVDKATSRIGDIHTASRIVTPGPNGGCLVCQGLIPPDKLQEEAVSPHERRAQRYVEDTEVFAPSVITLNALAASPVANDFMMMLTGLIEDDLGPEALLQFPRERSMYKTAVTSKSSACVWCSPSLGSAFARGDGRRLPTRPRRTRSRNR